MRSTFPSSPTVARSMPKRSAADNIENLLKKFKEPVKFTHLVAPGLAHQMPKEWQEKAEVEYRKYADKGRERPERIRFVTYTPKNGSCDWLNIEALERTYTKATIDAVWQENKLVITTTNVASFYVYGGSGIAPEVTIDGQKVRAGEFLPGTPRFEKRGGKWSGTSENPKRLVKAFPLAGPIDDALMSRFLVCGVAGGYPAAAQQQFAGLWDRYFRGPLPTTSAEAYEKKDA